MAIRQTIHYSFSSTLVVAGILIITLLLVPTAESQVIQLVNVPCDDEVKENSKCGAGGLFNGDVASLTGTFVCRDSWLGFFLGSTSLQTVCVPNVLNQVIGFENDQCGCCGGECPQPCTCVCDEEEDKVLIAREQSLFGSETTECVSRGRASRRVGDGNNDWYCVIDTECPPLNSPSVEVSREEEITEEVQQLRRVEPGD